MVGAEQGSLFAKKIAGDFNPIHDPESRRFCVPGDLLFALALNQYGLHKQMSFRFLDLVSADSELDYPAYIADDTAAKHKVSNKKGKDVLELSYSNGSTNDEHRIEQFSSAYVAFSGQNFPHILVPLMHAKNVMINPKRPLVIYESMVFELDRLEFKNLQVVLSEQTLVVDGRRGDVTLSFTLHDGAEQIGTGSKNIVLSGLREYDDEIMDKLCADYLDSVDEGQKLLSTK